MKRKYQYLDTFEETHTSMITRAFLAFAQAPGVIWDVGSSGGKVLIESKLRYGDVKLVGIEIKPEYEAIMHANMETHGVSKDAIDFVLRDATEDLSDLPKPDAIYLSIAGVTKEDIIPRLWALLNPGGVIVCNVSKKGAVERLEAAQQAFGGTFDEYLYYGAFSQFHNAHFVNEVLHWTGKKPV
jgi:precorrin-6B methylase 2